MRVLFVVPQDEESGGVASVVGNLARYLTDQGHQVFSFHPTAAMLLKRKTTKLGFAGFGLRLQMPFGERHPAISILLFIFLFPVGMYQLIRFIFKHKIQVINVHYPADPFVYFALCRRLLPLRLITSIHGADVFPNGKPRQYYPRAFKLLLSSSDLIVAPSVKFRRDFLTVFPQFNFMTAVIHNGIKLTDFEAPYTNPPRETTAPYVLCISAYKEQKAIDVLIRAFKRVVDAHPVVRLVLVGAGPLLGSLENLAASLGIQQKIDFLGPKPRNEVPSLIHGCQVFCLPSRFETFGIVILEAMACKKPVVATTAGGIPEIVENGETGILVEPDDPQALGEALLMMLGDGDLQRDLAANAYRIVRERFQSDDTGSAYEAVFTQLLQRKNSPVANRRNRFLPESKSQ